MSLPSRTSWLAALCLMAGAATASDLQVAPVSLTLQPTQNAEGLWLSNSGEGVVHAQVRVYHWTQEGGEDKLVPSRGLVVSPPLMRLAAADRQLVRAIRAGGPATGGVEDAYRLIIDELPADQQGRKGLQFLLRYSVPVFVTPATGALPDAPQLQWTLRREGDKAVLEVANTGGAHAQLADLTFTDAAGHRTAVHAGLLGYVLPGAQMRWPLKLPAAALAAKGSWQAMINGKSEQQSIALVDRSH